MNGSASYRGGIGRVVMSVMLVVMSQIRGTLEKSRVGSHALKGVVKQSSPWTLVLASKSEQSHVQTRSDTTVEPKSVKRVEKESFQSHVRVMSGQGSPTRVMRESREVRQAPLMEKHDQNQHLCGDSPHKC